MAIAVWFALLLPRRCRRNTHGVRKSRSSLVFSFVWEIQAISAPPLFNLSRNRCKQNALKPSQNMAFRRYGREDFCGLSPPGYLRLCIDCLSSKVQRARGQRRGSLCGSCRHSATHVHRLLPACRVMGMPRASYKGNRGGIATGCHEFCTKVIKSDIATRYPEFCKKG